MSSKILMNETGAFAGMNWDLDKYVKSGNTLTNKRWDCGIMYRDDESFSPIAINLGGSTRVDIQPTTDQNRRLEAMLFAFDIVNGAALTGTIFNPWMLFENIKCKVNNVLVHEMDGDQVIAQLSRNFLLHSETPDELFNYIASSRQELSAFSSITGDTIAPSATTSFQIDMFHLFPWLSNWKYNNPNSGIKKLSFELKLKTTYGAPASEGRFIKSSANTNIFTSTFSLTAMKIISYTSTIVDTRLYKTPASFTVIPRSHVRSYALNASSTSNTITVKLSEFVAEKSYFGFQVWLFNDSAITSYDDSDACKFYASFNDLRFQIKRIGTSNLVDHRTSRQAREFAQLQHEMCYGHPMVTDLLRASGDAGVRYPLCTAMIDFRHLDNDPREAEIVAGLDNGNSDNIDYEVVINAGNALGSSTTVYVAAMFWKAWSFDNATATEIPL